MIFYAIRHKASKKLMPQSRKDRGYSHWNPSDDREMNTALDTPRLLTSKKSANACIAQWAANPNARRSVSTNFYGEQDDIVDIKPDGRSKEDLEVVKVKLVIK